MFYNIDLSKFCNHKFLYSNKQEVLEDVGLDNTYVLKRDFINNNKSTFNDVTFLFSDSYYDNIVCDNQILTINQKANKIHIIAFSYWGSTNAFFETVFDDGSKEFIKIPFIDWVQKARVNYETISWFGENINTIKQVQSQGYLRNTVNFHHVIANIKSEKVIKEIIFPDNFLIHVFAITLENTE